MTSHHPHYALQIEQEFKKITADVLGKEKTSTSCEDVLRYMHDHQDKIWFMSWEFVGKSTSDGKFLSHRAPARASDLAIHESHLVEDRKIGRFKAYRLRLENLNLIEKRLGMSPSNIPAPKMEVEKCPHGLPTYVQCPNCKTI